MNAAAPTRPSLLIALRDVSNHRAWEDFVEIYTPLVFGHCTRCGLQAADAEDVKQEVMRAVARAVRGLEYDRARGTFRGWLLAVTRSKLHNFFASRPRHPQGTGDTAVHEWMKNLPADKPDVDWETDYRRQLFEVAARRVRVEFQEKTWTAFWRTVVEDEAVPRVATETGLSVGAIYIARSRVLARIREELSMLAADERV